MWWVSDVTLSSILAKHCETNKLIMVNTFEERKLAYPKKIVIFRLLLLKGFKISI